MALAILLTWSVIFLRPFLPGRDDPYSRSRPTPVKSSTKTNPALVKAAAAIPLAILTVGSIYFAIDAMRRTYRGHNTVAIAIAILGLLSFGLSSLVYYAIWGRFPLRPETQVFSTGFCRQCLASTTEAAAPDTGVYNLFFGTRLMGANGMCPTCKSVIRTFWVWFFIPLIPLGSYRIVTIDQAHYLGRRLHSLHGRQVLTVYSITFTAILIIAAIAFYFRNTP